MSEIITLYSCRLPIAGITGIRGRGNTTRELPKKPYKPKLDSKAPLMGLVSYKKWILMWRNFEMTGL